MSRIQSLVRLKVQRAFVLSTANCPSRYEATRVFAKVSQENGSTKAAGMARNLPARNLCE